MIQSAMSAISNLIGAMFADRTSTMNEYYANETDRINNSQMSEEAKAKALKKLDNQQGQREVRLQEEVSQEQN